MRKIWTPTSILSFFTIVLMLKSHSLLAREEIHVVQAISTSKRTFVLAKGIKDGVSLGQEVIISNENVTLVSRAIEVTRNYSLWEPIDKVVTVPFQKDEIVSFNPHSYGNVALNIDNIELPESFQKQFSYFRESNNWSVFYNYALGLYQTSSDVSTSNNSSRTGSQFGAEYHWRYSPEFELGVGVRKDTEVYRVDNGNVDVETSRTLLTASLTYHLLQYSSGNNNWYLTLTGGIGNSSTTLNEEQSTGRAYIAPEVRLGYLVPFTKTKALRVEVSIENVSSTEEFSDQSSQNNTIVNSKLSVGLRF